MQDIELCETLKRGHINPAQRPIAMLYNAVLSHAIADLAYYEIFETKELISSRATSNTMAKVNPRKEIRAILEWLNASVYGEGRYISFLDICTFFRFDESFFRKLCLKKKVIFKKILEDDRKKSTNLHFLNPNDIIEIWS